MLMVIFGAGASFDSCPTYPPGANPPAGDNLNKFHRPPLAIELFEDRPVFAEAIERYPECQPIVPRLRSPRGETVEAALEDLQARADSYARGVQQLAAVRYYLQHVIRASEIGWRGVARGVTNYKSLLNEIEQTNQGSQPVCLVTFNYDTLLEDALLDFGLPISAIADYTQRHPSYKLFKLHGSVNWAREVETEIQVRNPGNSPSIARELIARVTEIRISENYVLTGGERPVALVNGRPCFPAIAIPVEKKRSFECPQHMLEEFTALLPQVSKMLVIGWRATEEHFLGLLGSRMIGQGLKRGVQLYIVRPQVRRGNQGPHSQSPAEQSPQLRFSRPGRQFHGLHSQPTRRTIPRQLMGLFLECFHINL